MQPTAASRQDWERRTYDEGGRVRPYALYVPPRLPRRRRVPVMVVLHGCTQSAEDVAAGTRMSAMADRCGFVVVYPEQSSDDNPRKCWNWYVPENQVRGSGEPAAIAGIVAEVLRTAGPARLDRHRVYVVGLSAGGAMAAIMGVTYPDVFAGVGIHSGLAYAAASSLPEAMLSMRWGGPDPEERGRRAYASMGGLARTVPKVIFQGDRDKTVSARNGQQVVRQWLTTNRHASDGSLILDAARPDEVRDGRSPGKRRYDVTTWNDRFGRPLVQYWLVSGLGHAWSGGSAAGTYTDPAGPDATVAMWSFLREHRMVAEPVPRGASSILAGLSRLRRRTSRRARRAKSRVGAALASRTPRRRRSR